MPDGIGSDFARRDGSGAPDPAENTDRSEVPKINWSDMPELDGADLESLPGPQDLDASDLEAGTEHVASPRSPDSAASWALDPVYVATPPMTAAPRPAPPVYAPPPQHAPAPAPAHGGDAWVGRLVANRYQIERELAAGGMGRVYVATQVPLGRSVAIKVVRTEIHGSRQQFVRRFFLEAAACAKLTHPNIVTIHDYGETEEGEVFMAMEYLDGRSLDKEIKDTAPMPAERALHIAIQTSRALREAHAKGIIHRDLKPQNVMLVEQGDERDFVKVLDFGLVKMLTDQGEAQREVELTRAGVLLGSPNYMSPEQILGGALDGRTDIYSLGVVLFKMLAGKNPFARDAEMDVIYKHVHVPPPTFSSMGVDVHPSAEAVVMRCLAKRPEERFSDCKDLVIGLKEARREVLGQAARKKKRPRNADADAQPIVPQVITPPATASVAPVIAEDSRPSGLGSSSISPSATPPSPPSTPLPSVPVRPSEVAQLRALPSRVYLRSREGGISIGPLPLAQVEILFATRVIDESTPVSVDGLTFDGIASSAKLRDHLAAYRQQLVDGGRPWENQRASIAPATPAKSLLAALFRAAADQFSGTLTVSRPDGQLRLSYADGKILEVYTDAPALLLTRYLIAQHLFTQAVLDDQLPIPPGRSGDLGDALIAAGLVPPHLFIEHMIAWAKWALGGALGWSGDSVVLDGAPPQPPQIPLSFDRFGVLIEAVRTGADRAHVEAVLQANATRAAIPSAPQGATVDDLKLAPRELRLMRSVDGSKTIGELVGAAKNDKEVVQRTLFFATEIGLVMMGDDASVQKERAEAARLQNVLSKLRDKTPFEVLNASEAAGDDDVRARYMDLVKMYHPDNARVGAAPELVEVLRQLFVLAQESFAAIETQEKREKYKSLRELGYTGRESEEDVVRRVVEAEVSFKKAKTFVRLKKFDDAIAEMRQAVAKKPKDVELKIHLRYYEFLHERGGDRTQAAQKTIEDIGKMLKMADGELASPFLLLGQLYKLLGQDDAAVKAYKRVLKFDPRNHEAESELRLINMREQKKQKKGGLNIGGLNIGGLLGGQNKDK